MKVFIKRYLPFLDWSQCNGHWRNADRQENGRIDAVRTPGSRRNEVEFIEEDHLPQLISCCDVREDTGFIREEKVKAKKVTIKTL